MANEIPIPEEREAEEDLGPVADDSAESGAADGAGSFDLSIDVQIGGEPDPTELIDEHGPEEEEVGEEMEDEERPTQQMAPPAAVKKSRKKRKAVAAAADTHQ